MAQNQLSHVDESVGRASLRSLDCFNRVNLWVSIQKQFFGGVVHGVFFWRNIKFR
jgi:hypothetical protein